ncbi:DUF192 domain-containing protein [Palleronia caenipelagi]|uniref:DUF192 domain-containing protein n=1 Tax=Palleronia caenipelagi TaxID=2489174 RepID=A0A547QB51_9RHOB|nr:DUF192 domain-containing protein [Palleronia caenipelagi]TRD23621.1 DUF192 domain-containing protein [Palleronia caenipelagi]
MIARVLSVGVAIALAASPVLACAPETVELRGDWGAARFAVTLADTPDERARGLMFVEDMPLSEGMLFVYERTGPVSFWMRNTLIPLDMVFVSEKGVVQYVHENAIPGDETPIFGGANIRVVLEINGGLADQLGIKPGTQIRHPALDQDLAAWPCAAE